MDELWVMADVHYDDAGEVSHADLLRMFCTEEAMQEAYVERVANQLRSDLGPEDDDRAGADEGYREFLQYNIDVLTNPNISLTTRVTAADILWEDIGMPYSLYVGRLAPIGE